VSWQSAKVYVFLKLSRFKEYFCDCCMVISRLEVLDSNPSGVQVREANGLTGSVGLGLGGSRRASSRSASMEASLLSDLNCSSNLFLFSFFLKKRCSSQMYDLNMLVHTSMVKLESQKMKVVLCRFQLLKELYFRKVC